MTPLLAMKEFWLTVIATITALTLLGAALKKLVHGVREGVTRVAYIQSCLQRYGPTLIEIAEGYQANKGKALIESVRRIEALSTQIATTTKKTEKASDISIDILQAGVGALQVDIRYLIQAFESMTKSAIEQRKSLH